MEHTALAPMAAARADELRPSIAAPRADGLHPPAAAPVMPIIQALDVVKTYDTGKVRVTGGLGRIFLSKITPVQSYQPLLPMLITREEKVLL